MKTLRIFAASAALAAASLSLAAGPAAAGETAAAPLVCGNTTYSVTGFGRGQALHVVGSNQNFVVTRAQLSTGEVVFEAKGQQKNESKVECTAKSPESDRTFIFEGFFTPAGP